jgi:Ni/Fe-hydrogenase subunit HybB-like protein
MHDITSLGFLFPNEVHVHWTLMIVMYPYVTGLVAGAFIASSFYHVHGRKELEPISRFALVAALAFLLFATLPLLVHLGHPERALNIMITPNFTSAMAGFGFIYSAYMVILLLEIWLVFRRDIVLLARSTRGLKSLFYSALALGVYDISEESRAVDGKLTSILAAVGIPAACVLHGYVGFLFGAIKSNPWWSTPLMPVIFLLSAIVSGIAILILMYIAIMKFRREAVDLDCLQTLVNFLWLFVIIDVVLEILEILNLAYEKGEEWIVISQLLTKELFFSFFVGQILVCSVVPFLLLGYLVVVQPRGRGRRLRMLSGFSALLLLLQVFAMRWNVVIGGQLFSKSFRGFMDFHPEFLEKEGILVSAVIFVLPFIFIYIFGKILPLWKPLDEAEVLLPHRLPSAPHDVPRPPRIPEPPVR